MDYDLYGVRRDPAAVRLRPNLAEQPRDEDLVS